MAALLFALSLDVAGQEATAYAEAALYLESVAMPGKAKVCEGVLPGFHVEFQRMFEAWSKANASKLHAGEAFFRKESQKDKRNYMRDVEIVTSTAVKLLVEATPTIKVENCRLLLASVGGSMPTQPNS